MFTKFFSLFVILSLITGEIILSRAQPKCKVLSLSKIYVNSFSNNFNTTEDDENMIENMKKELRTSHLNVVQGKSKEELREDFDFTVGTKKINNNSEIIATVLIIEKIPEEVVEVGGKEEVLYKIIESEKPQNITKEGDNLRKLMSEEYMRQFGQIYRYYVENIKPNEMKEFCKKVITDFLNSEKKK